MPQLVLGIRNYFESLKTGSFVTSMVFLMWSLYCNVMMALVIVMSVKSMILCRHCNTYGGSDDSGSLNDCDVLGNVNNSLVDIDIRDFVCD
jgi:hypothetical protein